MASPENYQEQNRQADGGRKQLPAAGCDPMKKELIIMDSAATSVEVASNCKPHPSLPNARLIPLTQGQFAIVDEADCVWLSRLRWRARWTECTRSFRAVTGSSVYMHRLILGLKPGDGVLADHINHDSLDNRRANLRPVSPGGNQRNRRDQSIHGPGVWFDSSRGARPFKARAWLGGKLRHIGWFETATAAREAIAVAIAEGAVA